MNWDICRQEKEHTLLKSPERVRGCTEEIMRQSILPFPPLRLAGLDRRVLLGQWDRRETDPRSALRGKGLPWIDKQA